jgi:hypothetical protein
MVFKLVAGVRGRPATTWNMPISTYEYSLAALNTRNDFKHHYKNRIVQKWSTFKPSEVKLCRIILMSTHQNYVLYRIMNFVELF